MKWNFLYWKAETEEFFVFGGKFVRKIYICMNFCSVEYQLHNNYNNNTIQLVGQKGIYDNIWNYSA